jgi:hypothetical protein
MAAATLNASARLSGKIEMMNSNFHSATRQERAEADQNIMVAQLASKLQVRNRMKLGMRNRENGH